MHINKWFTLLEKIIIFFFFYSLDFLYHFPWNFHVHVHSFSWHPFWWIYPSTHDWCMSFMYRWMLFIFTKMMISIHECINYIHPWWIDVNCPSIVSENQSIMNMCIPLYDMCILLYIFCTKFILELMNVIQSKDNLQCIALAYFDLFWGPLYENGLWKDNLYSNGWNES